MSNTVHAFDFLAAARAAAVNVLFGDEPFLKRLVRHRIREEVTGNRDEFSVATLDGSNTEWKDAIDELSTVSLFGAGETRLVVIERADTFVTEHRARLEAYAKKPHKHGVLVLEVDRWQANTRLYKLVDKLGMQVDCHPPTKSGASKALDEKRIQQWLIDRACRAHERPLARDAANRLLEMVGPNLGLIDQELAKMALLSDDKDGIDVELVEKSVGGWRGQSIWELVDAATDGDSGEALAQLDRLIMGGEHPMALLGQISWSLRRFATATRIYEHEERQHRRPRLNDVLVEAGFPHWNRQALSRAEKQLKQLGRARAGRIHHWLLEADLALKGSHSTGNRARFVLERLLVRVGRPR